MLRFPIASAVFATFIALGTFTAMAQTPPRKTRSSVEVTEAIRIAAEKTTNCRRLAREQKLHFLKRRSFLRKCEAAP
jgi:hypothetical protein